MPNFLWTVKDEFGKTLVREITANTIEESKAMLLAEGCTGLRLKTDEINDAIREAFPDTIQVLGEEVEVDRSPETTVKHLGTLSQTALGQIFERVVQDKMIYLLAIALLVIVVFRGQMTIAIIIGIGMIGWLGFSIWMALPEIYYAKLNNAKDWHRWTDVLKLIDSSTCIRQRHLVKLPEWELVRCRAQALAGLGKLSEALTEFAQCENQPGMPSWAHKMFVATLYDVVKQHDKAVEYITEAIKEKPTPTLYLDLLFHLLHYKKDQIKAREVLAIIEKSTLTDIAEPFYARCCGILAYLKADYTSAQQKLQSSLEIFEQKKTWPFRDGNISLNKSYLCCVLAKQGNLIAAKSYFAQAKKYLVATDRTELLDECKRAIGE